MGREDTEGGNTRTEGETLKGFYIYVNLFLFFCGYTVMENYELLGGGSIRWNDIAISSTIKLAPVATERAIPINILWNKIPASRSATCKRSLCCCCVSVSLVLLR